MESVHARTTAGRAGVTGNLLQALVGVLVIGVVIAARGMSAGEPLALRTTQPNGGGGAPTVPTLATERLVSLAGPTSVGDPRTLLAVSSDGSNAIASDAWIGPSTIYLRKASGVANAWPTSFPGGPQAAAISPDGRTAAVVDGCGGLWRLDLTSMTATQVAKAGPSGFMFGRSIAFSDSATVLVQLVSSIHEPTTARIALVSIYDGSAQFLGTDMFAFGPQPLADGSYAYAHGNDDGSYLIKRVDAIGNSSDLAAVGFAHGWTSISPAGAVAYSDGTQVFVVPSPGAPAKAVLAGAYPRFAPDGQSIIAFSPTGASTWASLNGAVLGTVQSPIAAVVMCKEAC